MTAVMPGAIADTSAVARAEVIAIRQDRVVNTLSVAALVGIGLIGFRTVYESPAFLIAGGVGVGGGLAVGWWTSRTRQPVLVTAAMAIVAFFALGGVAALRSEATAGVLPNLDVIRGLADGAVRGWAKLLTVLPPAQESGNLLVVPYFAAFLAALLAISFAERTKSLVLPLVGPVAVLVVSILFGTELPAAVLLQGGVFAVVAVGWVSVRRRNLRRASVRQSGRSRIVAGVLVLAVAAAGSSLLGDHLPFAGTNERFILRDRSDTPFNPQQYPSPLSGFRATIVDKKDTPLFTVSGLEAGERLRLAVLDSYDGISFGVAGTAADKGDASGFFGRVGSRIPTTATGRTAEVHITVAESTAGKPGYNDVWIPTPGAISEVNFEGPRARQLQESFRYNRATFAGATADGLRAGDSYQLRVVIPTPPAADSSEVNKALAGASPIKPPITTEEMKKLAATLLDDPSCGPATSPTAVSTAGPLSAGAKLNCLSQVLRTGGYNDGDGPPAPVAPGHNAQRLAIFTKPAGLPSWAGNAEQYSATAAIVTQTLGIPTRVVMGFDTKSPNPDGSFTVKGSDVDAWIEADLAGVGWVPFVVTPDRNQPPIAETTNPQPRSSTGGPPPPPPPITIPLTEAANAESDQEKKNREERDKARGEDGSLPTAVLIGGTAVALPLLLIGGTTAFIVGLKRRRARRRRETGPPSRRVAAGWLEVTDLVRDLGRPMPRTGTRREVAGLLGGEHLGDLAVAADRAVFDDGEPTEEEVAGYWSRVEATRSSMLGELGRIRRIKAVLNLTSLRGRDDERRLRPIDTVADVSRSSDRVKV